MGEPARKFREEDVLPEDAVLGPGTFQNVDNGRVVHKDSFGPIPPSGTSKRYVKLSDDPTYGMSEEDAKAHRDKATHRATSYEHPGSGTLHTGCS